MSKTGKKTCHGNINPKRKREKEKEKKGGREEKERVGEREK